MFYVAAINYNGPSILSPVLASYSCVAPSQPNAPSLVSSTQTTLTLSWAPPSDYGGCALTGYELYVDNGVGGLINT